MRVQALLLLLFVAAMSCKKKVSTQVVNHTPDSAYSIMGINDIILKNNISQSIRVIYVKNLTDTGLKVTLSLSALPERTTGALSKTFDYLPYATEMHVQAYLATQGTYPMYITATHENGEAKQYHFDLVINETDNKDCANFFYNAIVMSGLKPKIINSYQKEFGITFKPDSTNEGIYITAMMFKQAGFDYLYYSSSAPGLPVVVNCNQFTLEIARQIIWVRDDYGTQPYYFEGSGNFSREDSSFIIHCLLQDSVTTHKEPFTIKGKFAL